MRTPSSKLAWRPFLHSPGYGTEELSPFVYGDWEACTSDLQQAFGEIIRSPNPQSLRLVDITNVPVSSLLPGSHLHHLFLSNKMEHDM